MTLIAGGEKAGKSYACALASASDLIDRTFWVGVGEDDPDEYGAIPGARFEIVEHDGTYKGIGTAVFEATQAPSNGKPNLIVLDSGTRLWDLLSEEAEIRARERAKKAAQKYKREYDPDADVTIGPDLWNKATDRWNSIIDLLRNHNGPSLITARLEQVTVMDKDGKPTKDKTAKIKAQKNLPYDVGVIVEIPSRGETYITGARSLKFDVPMDERKSIKDFTVHGLWEQLGVGEPDATAPRQHASVDAHASVADEQPPDTTPDEKPGGPDWQQAFLAVREDPGRLTALRNQGKQANLRDDHILFKAIERRLSELAVDAPLEGTVV